MSALDQAFIKAYDKPVATPPRAAGGVKPTTTLAAPAAAPARDAAGFEQIARIYQDGSLYRIDAPSHAVSAGSRLARQPAAPHFAVPPPTSPKRGVRRSLLRLLSTQIAAVSTESAAEPQAPPRVQRKVIIRHVAHRGAAAATAVPPPHVPVAEPATQPPAAIEREEVIFDLQLQAPQIRVQGHWDADAAYTADSHNLVIAPATDLELHSAHSLVSVFLDALPEPPRPIVDALAKDSPTGIPDPPAFFPAKSLDDEPMPVLRVDPPHAAGGSRPHLKFAPPANPAEPATAGPAATKPAAAEPAAQPTATNAPAAEELLPTPVESIVDAELLLADEPRPAEPWSPPELSRAPAEKQATPAAATAPVWEVDRLHWPRICQRLLNDQNGYFHQAGERLQAAVSDGLKTLAITGSRRGEGRTTLSLCLAHAAARAGIQVALLDADFARPSVASRLGLEITHGWQEAALGYIPLSEAAIKSLADNITILPLEISSARRGLSLADPRVTATLRAAAATFDLVIIDLGPLGPGERIAFPEGEACPLNATIVVRDLRFASASEAQEVGERLYDAGVEAVGIAENFVIESKGT